MKNRKMTGQSFLSFTLVALLIAGTMGDQGCTIRIFQGAPPPPPPNPAGPSSTPSTPPTSSTSGPAAPGTTTYNAPTVQILQATTTEVNGYAIDTQNPTNTGIKMYLLPVTSSTSPSTVNTAPLAEGVANLTDVPNNTVPGHGFRFTLSGVPSDRAAQIAAGQSIIVRANNNGQQSSTAATVLTSPTGTTTATAR